eukprot:9081501-Pyramimonas_sp.AAC.1
MVYERASYVSSEPLHVLGWEPFQSIVDTLSSGPVRCSRSAPLLGIEQVWWRLVFAISILVPSSVAGCPRGAL